MGTRVIGLLCLGLCAARAGADPVPPPAAPAPEPSSPSADDLYSSARQLFDQYAPPEVKNQVVFPSQAQFEEFAARLQAAMDGGDLKALAVYEPQARTVLAVLRSAPGYEGYADWLAARLEEIDVASQVTEAPPPPSPPVVPARPEIVPAPSPEVPPEPRIAPAPQSVVPYYDTWLERERERPDPAAAAKLMPRLRADFAAEGAPPQLAWLAEVESSFDPSACSPSGAVGLYQMKADTARELGLSTFLPDERTNPDKCARAAARRLVALWKEFGSWPLALAAYNSGEGRVSRTLADRHGSDYADIAPSLSSQTRMYVPEVCALVKARTGLDLR